jgi:pimeloyl-ACP methyl ester carboxylesterase
MTRMTPLLERNQRFAAAYTPAPPGLPVAQVLIVTCLDHRVDPAILVDWTIRMIVDTPLPVLLETLKVNADVDVRAELQKIQVPALIIHGDQDASAPIGLTGRKTAELIPAASLTVYPGAGHGLYASDHHALNADLLAFINGEASQSHDC